MSQLTDRRLKDYSKTDLGGFFFTFFVYTSVVTRGIKRRTQKLRHDTEGLFTESWGDISGY